MMIAVGAVIVLRGEPGQKRARELAERNMDLVGKLLVSELVLARSAPEPERKMRTALILDQIKTLESRGMFPAGSLDALTMRHYLADPATGVSPAAAAAAASPADAGSVFNALFVKRQVFAADAAMFRTAAGPLLLIQNLKNQNKEAEAAQLEAELIQSAKKRELYMTVGIFGGGALFALGIAGLFMFFSRHPPVRFYPIVQSFSPLDHSQLLDSFVLYLFCMFPVAYFVGGFVPESYRMAFQTLWIPAVFLLALVYHSQSVESNMIRTLFLGPDPVSMAGLFKEILWGVGGFVVIFPVALAAFALSPSLVDEHEAFKFAHPAVFALKDHFWLTAFLAVGLVPWCEEVMFRNFAYGYLRRFMRVRFAALLTGLIFAVLHPQGMIALPYLTVLGTGLAVLREFRPGIIASVTTHSLVNSVAVTAAYFALNG
ncbi:MAG: CPBP family intramembrane metalloprotease [Spirochaetia bacterium]|nr:CPBP family intramembrane metalloprotease [Spirochaetia bacterium]